MSARNVKGFRKGLRYISHIFGDHKEHEMQIGFPTDVKHVAHIGWDGPAMDSSAWMNDFKNGLEFSSAPLTIIGDRETPLAKFPSHDLRKTGLEAPLDTQQNRDLPAIPKQSRRHKSSGKSENTDRSKPTRRHKKSSDHAEKESTAKDTSKTTKRSRRKKAPIDLAGVDCSPRPSRPDASDSFLSDTVEIKNIEDCGEFTSSFEITQKQCGGGQDCQFEAS